MANDATIRAYLSADGTEIDPDAVRLTRTASETVAQFEAPRDGTYRLGVSIEATEIMPLAVCVVSDEGQEHWHEVRGFKLEAGRRYRVLRECADR